MMVKKLRLRFIRIALGVLSVAMVLVALVINGANWYFAQNEMLDTVKLIAQNGGQFPSGQRAWRGGRGGRESSYETRYFSVRRMGNGQFSANSMDNIASVTQAEALSLARQAAALGKESGFLEGFLFYAQDRDIIFLDCESRLSALKSLALISAAACGAGVLISLALVALLSRRAIAPLIESMEKQKRFITDAGHELKTPITVIGANMDLLEMDLGENEWVAGAKRQTAQLRGLVGNLVTLSKLDEADDAPPSERFDLSRAATETVQSFESMAEVAGKALDAQVEDGLFTRGDEGALRRMISILLDNAVKYAPRQSRITLSLTRQGRRARLVCRNDLDAPMEQDTLKRLFDRFYRADPARGREEGKGGYGIGLSIAQATAQRHGAKLLARCPSSRVIEFQCVLALSK